MSNPCPEVKLKLAAKTFVKNECGVKDIVEYIKTIPNYQSLKNELQFLEYIVNLAENVFSKKTTQEQKVEFIIKIMTALFGNVDVDTIKKQIQFLVNNNHVKRKTKVDKVFKFFSSKFPKF